MASRKVSAADGRHHVHAPADQEEIPAGPTACGGLGRPARAQRKSVVPGSLNRVHGADVVVVRASPKEVAE
eukprot:13610821-Alexandrium_andersonii.AAC.1